MRLEKESEITVHEIQHGAVLRSIRALGRAVPRVAMVAHREDDEEMAGEGLGLGIGDWRIQGRYIINPGWRREPITKLCRGRG